MESPATERPYARARRPMGWAFGLSTPLIVLWLGAVALLSEIAFALFGGGDWWIFGALVVPVFGLGLNCAAFAGVFWGAGWAPGATLARATYSVIAFGWLAYMGFWLVIAIVLLPVLGLLLLIPWAAELTAEVLFIIAWARVRKPGEPSADPLS